MRHAPRRRLLALALTLLPACAPSHRLPAADDPRWKPSASNPAVGRLDLVSAPDRPGPFVFLLRVPAGTEYPRHRHARELTAVLRAGTQLFDIEQPDGSIRTVTLRPGERLVLPAGTLHRERFPERSVVELRGDGPFVTERP